MPPALRPARSRTHPSRRLPLLMTPVPAEAVRWPSATALDSAPHRRPNPAGQDHQARQWRRPDDRRSSPATHRPAHHHPANHRPAEQPTSRSPPGHTQSFSNTISYQGRHSQWSSNEYSSRHLAFDLRRSAMSTSEGFRGVRPGCGRLAIMRLCRDKPRAVAVGDAAGRSVSDGTGVCWPLIPGGQRAPARSGFAASVERGPHSAAGPGLQLRNIMLR